MVTNRSGLSPFSSWIIKAVSEVACEPPRPGIVVITDKDDGPVTQIQQRRLIVNPHLERLTIQLEEPRKNSCRP